MEWLYTLFFGNGIAHAVLIFALVITIGILLGKVKIGGISLGVTWILFVGILFSHFGMTVNGEVRHFVQEFGLILFVYSIGLQVGPGFFSSFRKGGVTLNKLAVLVVALGVATTVALYYITGLSMTTMVGVMSGAVTNTPGLGAAQQAFSDLHAGADAPDIATGYALAYPLGVIGAILTLLALRYPRFRVINERPWKDYLYRTEELAAFAGRRYSGQRNHINKFRRDFPDAEFTPLTDPQDPRLAAFWRDYEAEFHKTGPLAVQELALAQEMFSRIGTGWFCAGGMMAEGRLVAVCLAEKCGGTLVNHIEKALYSHAGAYPALVQAFADHYGGDCQWCNREDDARDKGLRTSKLQYLPEALAGKVRMEVGTELDALKAVPTLKTERLTLTPLRKADIPAYSALCLDDERNRWWGYDYRTDLGDKPLTDTYFYDDARADFAARRALNFAVRLKGKLIGEVVLYRPDFRGGFEQGCRIAPEYAGHGYGTEAFAAAADWALYHLGLARVVAKCFKENEPSRRMLASCMRPSGEDETYFHFEKTV